MAMARKYLVDHLVMRWYHCISRCARAAFLLNVGQRDRGQWIEKRLQKLDANFAVSVGRYSVIDDHLHVLCRLAPAVADPGTDNEVIR